MRKHPFKVQSCVCFLATVLALFISRETRAEEIRGENITPKATGFGAKADKLITESFRYYDSPLSVQSIFPPANDLELKGIDKSLWLIGNEKPMEMSYATDILRAANIAYRVFVNSDGHNVVEIDCRWEASPENRGPLRQLPSSGGSVRCIAEPTAVLASDALDTGIESLGNQERSILLDGGVPLGPVARP